MITNFKLLLQFSCFLLILILSFTCYAAEEPPKIGNFALPASQQPGNLIGFGQNILEKNQLQSFLLAEYFVGKQEYSIDIVPSITYGITDNFSVVFEAPMTPRLKENNHHSSGLEDISLQLEYAFFNKSTCNYEDEATIVAGSFFPSGCPNKTPPTGAGAMSYFLGLTYSRMTPDWIWFTAHGMNLKSSHHGTRFGNQFLYQFGLGRNICNIDSEWIFAWVAEVDGTFSQKNKILSETDPDSGGNIIYLTPSLWLSSEKLMLQAGVGFPIAQRLNGTQNRNQYLLVVNLGWTF